MFRLKTDQSMIEHISRHTILIERVIPQEDRENVQRVIERSIQQQHLSRWIHRSGLKYVTRYSLTPLSDQSLIRSLGILLFCQQSEQCSLLTQSDIEHWFPSLFRHGLPRGHYLDQTSISPRLGHIRVDASCSKVNRLAHRTTRLIDSYRGQPGFRKLIDEGRFELTWIVPTSAKQRRLTESLAALNASGVQTRVYACPELLNLLAPIPHD